MFVSAAAHAQLFRAYLASTGSDGNPCTLPAPCRLLPAALAAVASGGEIWMLDSANYNSGMVTVGKSVSILAVPGAVGSLVALNNAPAIFVAADGLTIALRNVVIGPVAGATAGTEGVRLNGASTVAIEQSLIANLTSSGVVVLGSGKLRVTDSTLRNNAGFGIVLQNGASAAIASTRMLDNGFGGVYAAGTSASTTIASVSDSLLSGGGEGVQAYTSNRRRHRPHLGDALHDRAHGRRPR